MLPGVPRFPWLKVAAACLAIGLHAVVLTMVLASPVAVVAPGRPDALDVQLVELAPAAEPAAPPAAGSPPLPGPEVASAPDPRPAPPPVAQTPEPDTVTEPPPPKKSEPVHESEPAREPEPAPRPRPKARPHPVRVNRSEAPPRSPAPVQTRPDASGDSGPAQETLSARGRLQAVDPERPRTVGQVDYLGRRPTPVYPRLSERRGEQGRVVLRVLISPEGRVADVKVQRSSGYARLDEAAIQAMRQARFRPYTENGIAYKALVDVPFDFVL